jgi:radical SAM protein with 4Fe4S-binding SPASM domain
MARLVSRSLAHHLPLNVHFDLTYRCNERCVHCYLDHEDHGELTTAEVRRVLEELAAAGTLFLTFSGGEIFLRADLFELLEWGRHLRFDLSLKTNGLLITAERAQELRRLGVRRVQISLYSAEPEVHDAITRAPGSFERTLQGIHRLQQAGLNVKLSCPLMKQNLGAFRGVQRLAEALGIPYILDPTITPMLDGDRSVVAHRVRAEELLPVFSDPVLNPRLPKDSPRNDSPPAESAARAYDNIPCSAGHNSCYISPYGDVFPCVQMPLPAGNLRRQPFAEIWYGSRQMQRVRAVRESMLEICSSCGIKQYCQRCPGLAQMEDGDLLGPSSRACELAELNARLAEVPDPVSRYHQLQRAGELPTRGWTPAANLVTIAPLRAS